METTGMDRNAVGEPWRGEAMDVERSQAHGLEQALPRARLAGPVRRSITIAATPDAAYRFWRDLHNLPTFMERLESLEVLASGRSRWRLRAPKGLALTWEADIVEDRASEIIRWQSVEGSEIANRGVVRFRPAPGDQGTEIAVELEYVPPGGELGR